MAVLRSGKITSIRNRKSKDLLKKLNIKECRVKLDRINAHQIVSYRASGYNLRSRSKLCSLDKVIKSPVSVNNGKKQIAHKNHENVIWNEMISREYVLGPGVIVMAKMNKYRPWPARINTIYKVGDVVKCFVSFYGTLQIGSVLKKHCVCFSQCDLYLSSAVSEIKRRFKWEKNYDKIAESSDSQRAHELVKLTQIQQFLLGIREVEKLHNIPYEHSITKSSV